MRAFQRPQTEVAAALTPRQQQVLKLLVAGRTNPEIAVALGVSLAGAKWHVSEVISRLGVTSREEAAEYWREQNRLPSRFARAMRGLLGAGLLKTVAAGAAAATLGGGVVLAVTVLDDGGDGTEVTLPGPIFSEAEARARATYSAGEYLKMTDIPQTTQVDGRPISIADLEIVELLYTPPGGTATLTTVRYSSYGGRGNATWSAVLRRENVQFSELAWTDGRMTVTVTFEDGTGKVQGAAAGGSSKQMDEAPQPQPEPPPDPALRERVTDFFPVMRLDSGDLDTAFSVYQTRGGDWCWAEYSDEGGGGTSCGLDPSFGTSPDVFGVAGNGPRARTIIQAGQPGYVHGAVSERVDHVLLDFERGDPVVVTATDFPSQTGLPWRAFATVLDAAQGDLLAIHPIAGDGERLSSLKMPKRKRPDPPPYIVRPVDYINFSGSGDGEGGTFRLPPPAFPVKIALTVTYDGEGPIAADLLCDTASLPLPILNAPGPVGGADGSLVVDLPPHATTCTFVVRATGSWRFESK